MNKTQIQLPDGLYREAKRVARERKISLADVMHRGLEHIMRVYPRMPPEAPEWTPPQAKSLGGFQVPVEDWRLLAN